MLLRADIQITTVIKSLTDVIVHALDPGEKVAIEQIHIIVSQLKFLQEHLPLQTLFDADELGRLQKLASDLASLCEGEQSDLATALGVAGDQATQTRAHGTPEQVAQAILDLRVTCSSTTTSLYGADKATRDRLAGIVMAYSAEQTLRDRAWVVSQGWEADPDVLPKIEDLLRPGAPNLQCVSVTS